MKTVSSGPSAPPPVFNEFVKITPPDFPVGDGMAWAATVWRDRLYVACTKSNREEPGDFRRILRFDTVQSQWTTLFRQSVRAKPSAAVTAVKAGTQPPRVRIFSRKETLYVQTEAAHVSSTLQSKDAETFTLLKRRLLAVETGLHARQTALDGDVCYALAEADGQPGLVRLQNDQDAEWEVIPGPREQGVASCLTVEGRQLLMTIDDPEQGFSLHTKTLNAGDMQSWSPVLLHGAHRYALNAEAMACIAWKNALYIACGKQRRKPGQTYDGFEIVRIGADKRWDLIVGSPRVSPDGLKVPLSGLGPGMDEFRGLDYRFLQSAGNVLFLGAYSDIEGLVCWATKDGIEWKKCLGLNVDGSKNVCAARAIPFSGGLYMVLETVDPIRGQELDIWFRLSDPAENGSDAFGNVSGTQ